MKHAWFVWVLAVVAACSQPSAAPTDAVPMPQPTMTSHVVKPLRPAFAPPIPPPPEPVDMRSKAEIDVAACTAADGSWRCAMGKPKAFGAAGSTPIIPASWTVPSWFVNKSTGSDSNPCTSSGSPCATKQEIWVHRLGANVNGPCPRFQQTTTLEQDASDTDNTDPIYVCAANEKGGSFVLKGGAATCTAATFTRATAKNTAAGTNSLLSGSFSAGAPAPNMLIVNTTVGKSSRAWIYKSSGGANWLLSQPMTPVTVPTQATFPTEVDTWASTDSVQVCTPIAINVAMAQGFVADQSAAGLVATTASVYLYNMTIFDPLGAGSDLVAIGSNVNLIELTSQRYINVSQLQASLSFGGQASIPFINVDQQQNGTYIGGMGGTPDMIAGIFNGLFISSIPNLDDDIIVATGAIFLNGFFSGGAANGHVYLDATITVQAGTVEAFSPSLFYGSGSNTINLIGSSHFWNQTGSTFQTIFTAPGLVTGIQLNGKTTVDCITSADPGVTHSATTTPAHLDAACGAGTGLGSAAFVPAGASVANF